MFKWFTDSSTVQRVRDTFSDAKWKGEQAKWARPNNGALDALPDSVRGAGKKTVETMGHAAGDPAGAMKALGGKTGKYIKGAALLAAVTAGAVYLGSQFKGKRVTEESIADEPADYETLSQFNPPEAMDPEMPANEMAAAPAPADGKDDEYWQNYVRNGIEGPERANTPTPRIAEDLKADNVSAAQPSLSA